MAPHSRHFLVDPAVPVYTVLVTTVALLAVLIERVCCWSGNIFLRTAVRMGGAENTADVGLVESFSENSLDFESSCSCSSSVEENVVFIVSKLLSCCA